MLVKYESDNHAKLFAKDGDEIPVGWMQATFSGIWVACPDHGFTGAYFHDKYAALLAADEAIGEHPSL